MIDLSSFASPIPTNYSTVKSSGNVVNDIFGYIDKGVKTAGDVLNIYDRATGKQTVASTGKSLNSYLSGLGADSIGTFISRYWIVIVAALAAVIFLPKLLKK